MIKYKTTCTSFSYFKTRIILDPCPEQFTYLKSVHRCYRVDQTSNWNWEDGRQRCQSQGADLAMLQTTQETTALADLSKSSKFPS